MAGFSLEINSNGKWKEIPDKGQIHPDSGTDELRLHFAAVLGESANVYIDNGDRDFPRIKCDAGKDAVSLGPASRFLPGALTIDIQRMGHPTERITCTFHAARKDKTKPPVSDTVSPKEKDPILPKDVTKKTAENEKILKEKKTLEIKLAGLESLLAEQSKENQRLSEEKKALETELDRLRSLITEAETLEKAISHQESENGKKQKTLDKLKNDQVSLDLDIQDARELLKTERDNLDSLDKEISEARDREQKLIGQKNEALSNAAKAKEALDEAQQKLADLQAKHTDSKKAREELIEERKKLGMLDEEIQAVQKDIQTAMEALESIRSQKTEAEAEKAEAEAALDDVRKDKADCDAEAKRLQEETASVKAQNEEASAGIEKLQTTYRENMNKLKAHLDKFFAELNLGDVYLGDVKDRLEVLEKCLSDEKFRKNMKDSETFRNQIMEVRRMVSELDQKRRALMKIMEDK